MFVFLFLIVLTILLVYIGKTKSLRKRFKGVTDQDEELAKVQLLTDKAQGELTAIERQKQDLAAEISDREAYLEKLESAIAIIETGIYEAEYDFENSQKYKEELDRIINKEKEMIKERKAMLLHDYNTSKDEKKRRRDQMKLMLRVFNNDSDSSIKKVKWNNFNHMEKKIKTSFDTINKLGETSDIRISGHYRNWKLKELRLVHEYQEKLNEEKEEQKRIKEIMREEEKVRREIAKAEKEARDEENRYQDALKEAMEEAKNLQGDALETLNEKIVLLEQQLKDAEEKKERALSMAQRTKTGHVYVISNIGSFGKNVFKIGMTRRLEPMDRVKELGDASVPFEFDVHAMINTDDAPKLENKLHQHFAERRVNLVNDRKEFFFLDDVSEVERIVNSELRAEIQFTKLAQARQYNESQSLREKMT
ncbi:DUF4041 domain-containing protein [Candidatus Haliotispira prima]|uniref:DUF4041 domain-containing protein n=1 Tax=Candidatus Haliotispira prima TaxID=3034016 RepID=A0ABY8MEN0_9SPIO|nr:DUF4041 domain-containing protein [Candidatus Haliotispira prima]